MSNGKKYIYFFIYNLFVGKRIINGKLKIIATSMICLMLITTHTAAQSSCGYEVSTVILAPGCPDPFFCDETYGQGLSESINGGLPYVVGNTIDLGFDDAFLWTQKTGMDFLDMPPGAFTSIARGISPDGRYIVGDYDLNNDTFNNLGFLIDDGKFIEINPPSPPPQASFSQANAVNSSRQVTGSTVDPITGFNRAFFWQNDEMILIEPIFGPRTVGSAINEVGTIVGWMGTAPGINSHAFLWEKGKTLDIGVIPGGFTGAARAVNANNQIIVRGRFNDDHPQGFRSGGFLWEKGQWTDLGMLPGYDSMALTGINDAGQIIGWSWDIQGGQNPDTAFVWHDGVMTSLNDLIPPESQLFIFRVNAINNAGQITGAAADENNDVVSFILTPISKPIGDIDGDCEVDIDDLCFLLDSWGQCENCISCPADLNQDCKVSTEDLLLLFVNWS